MKLFRQGDLALVATPPPSSGVQVNPKAVLTLAIGGDSSHMHQLLARSTSTDVLVVEESTELGISPPTAAWRHDPIVIPPGTYRPVVQREYSPGGASQIGD